MSPQAEDESEASSLAKERLKKLVASEELDQLMQVVGTRGWISLSCCFTVIFIVLVWSFLGAIPVKVQGNGISTTVSGPYLVIAHIDGSVAAVCAKPGETVEKDALIARLSNSTLNLNIQLKRQEISQKQAELQALIGSINSEKNARNARLEQERTATIASRESAQNSLPFLEKDLAAKQRLQSQGILAPKDVEEAKEKLAQAQVSIKASTATLARIQEDLTQAYRTGEITSKQDEVFIAQGELERLLLDSEDLEVRAGHGGRILEIVAAAGDHVSPGAEIASIEIPLAKGELLQYFVLFPAKYGELLDVQEDVEIEVSGVDPKLYGYLMGKVKYISPYPVTMQDVKAEVRNEEIATYLKDGSDVVYAAVIALCADTHTKSGYCWTGKVGPPWPISAGTIGTARAVVQRQAPIVYILPLTFSHYFHELVYD